MYSTAKLRRAFLSNTTRGVIKWPWLTIAICLVVCAACASGLTQLSKVAETRALKMFYPQDVQNMEDQKYVGQFFPWVDHQRKELYITSRNDSDCLTPEGVQLLWKMYNVMMDTVYKDDDGKEWNGYNLCHRSLLNPETMCYEMTALDYFDHDDDIISNLTDPILLKEEHVNGLTNARKQHNNGRLGLHNWSATLGEFKVGEVGIDFLPPPPSLTLDVVESAPVLAQYLYTKNLPVVEKWEANVMENVDAAMKDLTPEQRDAWIVIYRFDAQIDEDSSDVIMQDISLALIVLIIQMISMVVLASIDWDGKMWRGNLYMGFAMVTDGLLILLATFGLNSYAGVTFATVAVFVPFVVLPAVIVDSLQFLYEFRRLPDSLPPNDRVVEAMVRTGSPTLVCLVCGIAVYAFVTTRTIPALSFFAIHGTVSLLFAALLHFTFIPACMALEARRIYKSAHGDPNCSHQFHCVCRSVDAEPSADRDEVKKFGYFASNWSRASVVMMFAFFVLCFFAAINTEQGMDTSVLSPDGSVMQDYYAMRAAKFSTAVPSMVMIEKKLDDTPLNEQFISEPWLAESNEFYKTLDDSDQVFKAFYYQVLYKTADAWQTWPLHQFLKHSRLPAQDLSLLGPGYAADFTTSQVPNFFDLSMDDRLDFIANGTAPEKMIATVYMNLETNGMDAAVKQWETMEWLREYVETNTGDQITRATVAATDFAVFELYNYLLPDIKANVIWGTAIVLILTFLLTGSLGTAIFGTFSFLSVVLWYHGTLYVFHDRYDTISSLTLAVGFAYAIYDSIGIAVAMVHPLDVRVRDLSTPDRVKYCIQRYTLAPALKNIVLVIGCIPLSLWTAHVFKVCYHMFLGISLAGLFHCTIFVPSLFAFVPFNVMEFAFCGQEEPAEYDVEAAEKQMDASQYDYTKSQSGPHTSRSVDHRSVSSPGEDAEEAEDA